MLKKKNHYKKDNKTKEPTFSDSNSMNKTIRIFSSFEEQEKFEAKERAGLSYDERLLYIEQLRKIAFNKYLLPDGQWPSLKKSITITKPHE